MYRILYIVQSNVNNSNFKSNKKIQILKNVELIEKNKYFKLINASSKDKFNLFIYLII